MLLVKCWVIIVRKYWKVLGDEDSEWLYIVKCWLVLGDEDIERLYVVKMLNDYKWYNFEWF